MRTDAITPVRNRPSTVFLPDMIAFKYTLCSVNSKQHMHLVHQIISNYIKLSHLPQSLCSWLKNQSFYDRHVSAKRPNMDRDVLFRTVLLVIHWVCSLSLCLLEAHAWCQSQFTSIQKTTSNRQRASASAAAPKRQLERSLGGGGAFWITSVGECLMPCPSPFPALAAAT